MLCGSEISKTPKRFSAKTRTITLSPRRSEEHTSELQSQSNLVCRLLLEKKKSRRAPASRLLRRQTNFVAMDRARRTLRHHRYDPHHFRPAPPRAFTVTDQQFCSRRSTL